ncbi:MAG TPA: VWA domain-containing protein [Vicinamibacterales bacterium]|jgi:hypothetical protein
MSEGLLPNLLVFARALRTAGVSVRAGGVADAVRALAIVGVARRRDVRDTLRTVLILRHDDFPIFDEIFERFWRVWPDGAPSTLPRPMRPPRRARASLKMLMPASGANPRQASEPGGTDNVAGLQTYSADEAWRKKDFATFTPEDIERARLALAKLAWTPGERVTRRWVPGKSQVADLRRMLRANARHGGELMTIPRRVRRVAPRPLVLLCDVSGSMEPYTRMLLLFAHEMARGARRVEVFVFSTRLTRVTAQFAELRLDVVLDRLRDAVHDWSGGTRIGEAIRVFNADWARRVVRRQPVLLLISDGWDLGDPDLLAREIARLQRSVHRLIWLNPLLGSPGYEPLTRGLRAALPFVDDFLPVHDMSSLEALARRLNDLRSRV